ncbi:RING finger and CHY zinc finger domain-containing protein 1 [Contarinia nasturtii]|uniref:RING finger and CHY zinc finger domain-containing protein 1 n=1 Tax=Contarinia nasturtii TaxID=265458 RepID=UPI0012D3B9EB|nr:RING finger and CHY zinc finger domain-containing protein 1 [Contarinia nasturtii]
MEKNGELSICEKLPDVKLANRKDLIKPNADTDKVNTKKMAEGDKCINNNQDICMKIENMNSVNKTDCSVVIDDDTQSKQQVNSPPSQQTYGCVHYKRKAKFVTPCCGNFYNCRYCHDENEDHHFDRKTLTELICTNCDTRQKVQAECANCGIRFGKYTCLICNLFDDEDKDQYHCDGCGICRIGGQSNFFHCEVCNMCLPQQLKTNGHRCVENVSRSNCPVCLGDIHTSRYPCHIPDCGHLLHKTCFDQLLASGHYVCPTCQMSMIDMTKLWEYLDTQAQNLPVPKSHENSIVDIFCNDCFKQSTVKFHFIGLKCANCGGYNTTKNIKTARTFSFSSTKDNPSTSA